MMIRQGQKIATKAYTLCGICPRCHAVVNLEAQEPNHSASNWKPSTLHGDRAAARRIRWRESKPWFRRSSFISRGRPVRVKTDKIKRLWDRIILRPGIFQSRQWCHGVREKLDEKLRHKFGLQLEHVVVKSTIDIAVPVDFEDQTPLGAWKLALRILQEPEEHPRGIVKIFVRVNPVG